MRGDAGDTLDNPDIMPSRGVTHMDSRVTQEWCDRAEALSAQSHYAEAERLFTKVL